MPKFFAALGRSALTGDEAACLAAALHEHAPLFARYFIALGCTVDDASAHALAETLWRKLDAYSLRAERRRKFFAATKISLVRKRKSR